MAHDWGNNTITIQGIGTVKTVTVTKRLGGEIRRPWNVIVLQLSKCYHKATVVFNRNDQFTLNNSICENHKYGNQGY